MGWQVWGRLTKPWADTLASWHSAVGLAGKLRPPPRLFPLCTDGSQDAQVRGSAVSTPDTLVPC